MNGEFSRCIQYHRTRVMRCSFTFVRVSDASTNPKELSWRIFLFFFRNECTF